MLSLYICLVAVFFSVEASPAGTNTLQASLTLRGGTRVSNGKARRVRVKDAKVNAAEVPQSSDAEVFSLCVLLCFDE